MRASSARVRAPTGTANAGTLYSRLRRQVHHKQDHKAGGYGARVLGARHWRCWRAAAAATTATTATTAAAAGSIYWMRAQTVRARLRSRAVRPSCQHRCVSSTPRRRPNPHLHRADMIVTAIFGDVRICVVRCSQLALDAQRRWNWSEPDRTSRWGQHAAFANMYSAFMAPGERVKATLELPTEELFAEAISVGEVRGFSSQISPSGESGARAEPSLLLLDRIRYGMRQPHHTSVPSCGDIRRTWQRVYDDSEQISTFTCAFSVMDAASWLSLFLSGQLLS